MVAEIGDLEVERIMPGAFDWIVYRRNNAERRQST